MESSEIKLELFNGKVIFANCICNETSASPTILAILEGRFTEKVKLYGISTKEASAMLDPRLYSIYNCSKEEWREIAKAAFKKIKGKIKFPLELSCPKEKQKPEPPKAPPGRVIREGFNPEKPPGV